MKKIIVAILIASVAFTSCSTDFKVGADYKDITAIYCLLSKSDSAHYVKVTKGFYDETINNLILAQNPDSLYYNNLEVKIEELNNGNVTNTFVLPRVDLTQLGIIKAPGTFVDSPNYAYQLVHTLNSQRIYRLRVKNLSTGKEITGETDIIDSARAIFPISNPFTSFDKLNFSEPSKTYNFAWTGPSNAAFFDVVIRFHYQEKNTNTLVTTELFKDLPVLKNISATGGNINVVMDNVQFYKTLLSEVGTAPSFITRYVDTPDLLILAGGQVLKTYVDVNSAQGGITYDQIKPIYTNLSGENVMGIFSTRVTRSLIEIPYTEPTFDSIINGQFTKNLNFVGKSTK